MANLLLLRHGSTKLNKGVGSAEKIRGWVDVPLDAAGKREATALAAQMATKNIGLVVSSDLSRAKDVGMAIARAAHVPLVPTTRLRPWNLGEHQGKKVDEVIGDMEAHIDRPAVPIKGGEAFDQFRMRYLPYLDDLLQRAKASSRDIVAVTHSRNLQLAKSWEKVGRPDDYSFDRRRMANYEDETPPGGHIVLKP